LAERNASYGKGECRWAQLRPKFDRIHRHMHQNPCRNGTAPQCGKFRRAGGEGRGRVAGETGKDIGRTMSTTSPSLHQSPCRNDTAAASCRNLAGASAASTRTAEGDSSDTDRETGQNTTGEKKERQEQEGPMTHEQQNHPHTQHNRRQQQTTARNITNKTKQQTTTARDDNDCARRGTAEALSAAARGPFAAP
jgi:hypothetical protein